MPAARVNERHGLGGCGVDAARLLKKNRAAMRQRLDEVDLHSVRWRVVRSAAELAGFVHDNDGPAVVKPLDEGGSRLVSRIDRPTDAAAVWYRNSSAGRDRMLAEEFLTGPEISVEAFTVDGRHTMWG